MSNGTISQQHSIAKDFAAIQAFSREASLARTFVDKKGNPLYDIVDGELGRVLANAISGQADDAKIELAEKALRGIFERIQGETGLTPGDIRLIGAGNDVKKLLALNPDDIQKIYIINSVTECDTAPRAPSQIVWEAPGIALVVEKAEFRQGTVLTITAHFAGSLEAPSLTVDDFIRREEIAPTNAKKISAYDNARALNVEGIGSEAPSPIFPPSTGDQQEFMSALADQVRAAKFNVETRCFELPSTPAPIIVHEQERGGQRRAFKISAYPSARAVEQLLNPDDQRAVFIKILPEATAHTIFDAWEECRAGMSRVKAFRLAYKRWGAAQDLRSQGLA